jgi:hypothetical protein
VRLRDDARLDEVVGLGEPGPDVRRRRVAAAADHRRRAGVAIAGRARRIVWPRARERRRHVGQVDDQLVDEEGDADLLLEDRVGVEHHLRHLLARGSRAADSRHVARVRHDPDPHRVQVGARRAARHPRAEDGAGGLQPARVRARRRGLE